jgi:hypothetical protein
MAGAEKISGRLPHFYKHWDKGSIISGIVSSSGKRMDESEKEYVSIMRSHWVDTASGGELDRIGMIFSIKRKAYEADSDYRGRLKAAVISYKGGGTVGAIKAMVRIALGLSPDSNVEIVENPPAILTKTWKVRAGTEWVINPRNIHDTTPKITVSVDTEHAKITDPTITNLSSGQSITFKGDMKHGDVLKISDGHVTLNGKDVNTMVSAKKAPTLPRKRSTWKYSESIGANVGTFDSTKFDQSVFAIDILSSVTFEWTASQPASFEVRVPKQAMVKAGVTVDHLQDLIDSVKACGVKAEVKAV